MSNIYNKLFLSPYFFTIAIRHKSVESILDNPTFDAEYIVPATRLNWVADPILVEDQGNTYLFYEAFRKNKGRLEVVSVNSDCSISKPTVILEKPFHLSYPFVFKVKDVWYMVPETSEDNNVSIYQATDFPFKWEKKQQLLEEKAVDTTIFEHGGKLYLLTFCLHEGTERVTPKAYTLYVDNNITLESIEWKEYDELQCRGAGPTFQSAKGIIRPAQMSQDDRYGDQIAFYRIKCNEKEYREIRCGELCPESVTAKKLWFDGLHTYTTTSQYEAIDIRCRKFDLLKIPRTLIMRWLKH